MMMMQYSFLTWMIYIAFIFAFALVVLACCYVNVDPLQEGV